MAPSGTVVGHCADPASLAAGQIQSARTRYARLLIALLAWLIYYSGLAVGRAWISQGA